MKEVEIKARLINKEQLQNNLNQLGCVFGESISQEDWIYVKNIGSIQEYLSNEVFLRIRVQDNNNKILFTAKKRGINNLDAVEYEVEISSREEMAQVLCMMGYKEAARVKKKRQVTHLNNNEICIDNVEGLGDFIEMERLVESGDSETIQKELFSFFESIGIDRKDRIFDGYDILILKKDKM